MTYEFKQVSKEKIIGAFGNDLYERVQSHLKDYMTQWKVHELILIDSFSANLVFQGNSRVFGPVVMKFGTNYDEFRSKVEALKGLDGQAMCKLYEVDYNHLVLLEEAIMPGFTLREVKNIDVRLDVFCNLFKQLHTDVKGPITGGLSNEAKFKYKTYRQWINDITNYMDKKAGWEEVAIHMRRAKEYFEALSNDYKRERLLHGDFHYYNILEGQCGYKIIDPKGVIGNPIFDVPRYMLNEFWDEEDDAKVDTTMNQVFTVISKTLGIRVDVLSQLLYIEGTMAMCWNIQDGANIDDQANILETINWLYKYMN